MSVRRLIAELDTRSVNVSAFCVEHGVGRSQFYEIRRRYMAEGEAGLELRSRAPKRVPNRTPTRIEDRIVEIRKHLDDQGFDAGAGTIRWHLKKEFVHCPSEATIWRILRARGFITADPSKRPKAAYRSFAAQRANEVWQIDGTNWELADGTESKIINIIDDGSRLMCASRAHPGETFDACWETVCHGATEHRWPERFLCDNGRGLARLETAVAKLGIATSHSRPYHPQTCGKVERLHQTLKKWLAKQPPAANLAELQTQLDTFRRYYNHQRPHRSIRRRTPAQAWNDMTKTGPANQPLTLTSTISHSIVTTRGRVNASDYRISVGAAHANKPTTTIITGTQAHVFHNGELIRQLTIDPTKTSQPLHNKPGRPHKQTA